MATIHVDHVVTALLDTKDRPQTSVRSHNNDDTEDPWDVSTPDQLLHVVKEHPAKFLDMLKTLRTERDMFRQFAEGFAYIWNQGSRYKAERDKAHELLRNHASLSQPKPIPPSHQSAIKLPELAKAESTKGTSKSTKLPDPELFNGSGHNSYEVWESNMCHKLLGNHDHFPSETLRISYIASRLSGIPAERALARLSPRSMNPYNTA